MSLDLNDIGKIYKNSPFAFCVLKIITDAKGGANGFTIEYANEAFAKLKGATLDRINGLNNECLAKLIQTALEGKTNIFPEYDPETKKHVEICAYQIEYGYCACQLTDKTDAVNKARQLSIENEEMRQISKTIQGAVIKSLCNDGFDLIFANDVFYSFLGYTREEFKSVCGGKIANAIFPADLPRVQESFCRELPNGTALHMENRMVRKDGAVIWISAHAESADDGNGNKYLYGIFVDITEQKKTEEALRVSEEKFQIAMENSGVSFWVYDFAKTCIVCTKSSELKHGMGRVVQNVPESLIDSGYVRADSAKSFREMYDAMNKGAKSASGDFWFKTVEGKGWWCEHILYTTIFGDDGKPVRAYAVGKDVTGEMEQSVERKKLDIALSNSDMFIWEYDIINHTSIQLSKAMEVFGLPSVVNNFPQSVIDLGRIKKESAEDFLELNLLVEQGAPAAQKDICMVDASGRQTWNRCTYTTVFADGAPVGAIGCSVNIDAAKEAERRYRDEVAYIEATQSDDLLAKIRINLTKGFIERYVAKDSSAVSTDNMPYGPGLEQLASVACTKEERDKILECLNREKLLKDFAKGDVNCSIEYHRRLRDGGVIWAETTAKEYQNPYTGDIMLFVYTYDVSDKKIQSGIIEAVASSEYDYIAFVDLKNEHYKIYIGGEDIKRLMPVEIKNYSKSVYEVNSAAVVPEDRERAIHDMLPEGMREHLKKQQVFSAVYGVYDKDGAVRQKRVQYAYLDKVSEQVVTTRTDVTDLLEHQKLQQAALESALLAARQANSAKSDFLSRMSHEIRTPMNAIIGMSAIAAQSIGDDARIADCIGKIGISSRFLLSLINDILDMSRIESGKMLLKNAEIPFEEFINGVSSICYSQAQSKDIDYECTVDPCVESCYIGDAMKLQQVLINILSNAVKFTPHGGKVSMNVRQTRKTKTNAELRFTINDTGCGISEEFIPKMFEPFEQEHDNSTSMYGGTGLGLAISKNIVDLMSGHIGVRSIVGVGSEFTVDVTLGITAESRARYLKKPHYDFTQLKTLVVDDDVTVCEQAVVTLKEIGVASEWVDSGRKAVDKVRKKWAEKTYYDMILVDWKMPEMDGIETARQIRAIVGPDVTIIIMTAYDWANIENEARLAGVNLFISKPVFKSSLIHAFEKALGKQSPDENTISANFDFKGRRVLLVEDHPLNVEVAKCLLEKRGFAVDHAANGLRSIEMFTTNKPHYYDAILMDIRMPVMDGLQAANAIRHLSREDARTIPIIAMTANAFEEDVQKSMAVGMNAHLAKPIEPKTLYQTLYDFICRAEQK